MKIELDAGALDARRISAYQRGAIIIGGNSHHGSLIVDAAGGVRAWAPATFSQLAPEHFEDIAACAPELVLLGTGSGLLFPAPALLAPLARRGIGIEVMDTGAACRAYNFLLGEGRRVLAALLQQE